MTGHQRAQPAQPPWSFAGLAGLREIPLSAGRLYVAEPAETRPAVPTVLFVHGAYHGAWCFAAYMTALPAAGVRCAALDLRGHGAAPRPAGFAWMGAQTMATDVVEASAALDDEVVLAAHSLGALVAALAATQQHLAGFILLAPSPPGPISGVQALPELPEDALAPPPAPAAIRDRFLGGEDEALAAAYRARLTPESPALLNDRYGLRVSAARHRISGPALCLAAGRDADSRHPPGQDLAVARFFDAEYHFLSQAPHSFMLTPAWQTSATIMLRWLYARFPEMPAPTAAGAPAPGAVCQPDSEDDL